MLGSSSSSRARRIMEAGNARRLFAQSTSTPAAGETEDESSSGSISRPSSNPPIYGEVPSVHPPVYVDNENVPGYRHHRLDRLLESRPMFAYESESDISSWSGYTLRQVNITPPDNSAWLEDGWGSQSQLDDNLNDNLSYLRQVLEYLRTNWDTPINEDIEDVARRARSTYSDLTRQVARFYTKLQDRELALIEAKHQIFQHQEHSLWERNVEFLSHQLQKFTAKRRIRQARASRTDTLDLAMSKVHSQRQSIYFRSTGLAQA